MGKHVVVALFLFLSLSAAPIDAFRTESSEADIAKLQSGEVGSTEWHMFHTQEENCERFKTEFELRTQQVDELSQQMHGSGVGGFKTAQALLRLRSMTRVYERAARQECEWIKDRDVDSSALRNIVNENLSDNACFPQAHALLLHNWETQEKQVRAMHMATQFLATQQCTEEDAKRISDEMDQVTPEQADMITVDDQLEAANADADDVTDDLVESIMNEDRSLMQVGEGASPIASLNELIGLVAFLLIWAVMCIVFIPVILMVIGAVLCTLSWVLRRFLTRHQTNLGNCVGWWAHQTQLIFAPGNELITAGACLIGGYLGVLPNVDISVNLINR